MRYWHRGQGIHRSLLDSAHADSGDPRSGGLPGERQTRQKRARATYGRVRLSVVIVFTLRIPMMSISHSDLMPIRTERSDAGLSQCETVIDIRQEFSCFSLL